MDGLRRRRRNEVKSELIDAMRQGRLTEEVLDDLILRNWPRGEKVAHKDIKMRTFISQEKGRDAMVSHVYDITYGLVTPRDNLVVLDDSIVRGTTLRKSILQILARTRPKRIIIVSTAPQIRYPDCYGIDMSELGKFIAFQAAVELLKKRGKLTLLESVYKDCKIELEKPIEEMRNCVKRIYEPFTAEEISAEIGAMVYPQGTSWHGEVVVVYQTVENLARALPEDCGMWYFTGDYPTPGGYEVVNRAFVNYHEQKTGRVYDLLFAPSE
jgi:amidophosphoribosyltransferase